MKYLFCFLMLFGAVGSARGQWTANTHIERIYQKLAVHNEARAVAKAIQERLLLVSDTDYPRFRKIFMYQ